MATIVDFIVQYNLGDIASVIGLIIVIIGFIVTVWNVMRSKTAAEQAQKAVSQVQKDIVRTNTISDFASAMSSMEEIRRLHRQAAWEILPDRYSQLKKYLISIKESNADLQDMYKRVLQSAIQNFTSIEEQVEKALFRKSTTSLNVPQLNQAISKQIEKTQKVLEEIKNQVGR